jgi:uncharacterized protein involved in exopolysaccharide biosynthesis
MSVDKYLEKSGVTIAPDNTLPPGQRTKKDVSRLIHAVRAAESSFNDAIHEANQKAATAQERCIELQARVSLLEKEVLKYRLKERMESMDSLSVADRQLLLTSS